MKYQHKTKWFVFAAAILTSVLLCGAVFAGAYTAEAVKNVQTASTLSPIRISGKDITSGGQISLGSQTIASGTECRAVLTWIGDSSLTVICTSSSGTVKSISVENGKTATLKIESGGEYTIAVKNNNAHTVSNVNGTLEFMQGTQSPTPKGSSSPASLNTSDVQTVTYENVEMRRYEGESGHPYIHDIKTNGTTKKITGYEYGMLAFDKDGNPLKIDWWCFDTEAESAYFNLDETTYKIAPSGVSDVFGGWSLNFFGTDLFVEQIAYVLYCDKKITFEDGTVWINQDFDNWRSSYEGKKVDVNILKGYYPYEQKITFDSSLS